MREMKRHDTAPSIRMQVVDENGAPRNLTGATAIKFYMRLQGALVLKVSADAILEDALTGMLAYLWGIGDTDTAGTYEYEFEFMLGGKKYTVPNRRRPALLLINPDLNNA